LNQKGKKPIPRLRLEEIPTFHGHNKSNKPMPQYQIPIKANHDSDENGKNKFKSFLLKSTKKIFLNLE
jgi:hypothetical protein